jgi:hypothetical protein
MNKKATFLLLLVLSILLNLVYSLNEKRYDESYEDLLNGEFWGRNEKGILSQDHQANNEIKRATKLKGFLKAKGKGKRFYNNGLYSNVFGNRAEYNNLYSSRNNDEDF